MEGQYTIWVVSIELLISMNITSLWCTTLREYAFEMEYNGYQNVMLYPHRKVVSDKEYQIIKTTSSCQMPQEHRIYEFIRM